MSGTEDGNSFYSNFCPDSFIYSELDSTVLEKLVNRQKILTRQGKANPVFLVLDDCAYDRSFYKSKLIRGIFFNGRHWKLGPCIITSQYCLDLGPVLRYNIDYLFVMKENMLVNRERLYKYFFGMFDNFQTFNTVMNATTENYECLVLDNTTKSNKLEDMVYWYKASLHTDKPFRMGCAGFWEYHHKNYNPKYYEEETDRTRQKKGTASTTTSRHTINTGAIKTRQNNKHSVVVRKRT
jgi:hypothetical protein